MSRAGEYRNIPFTDSFFEQGKKGSSHSSMLRTTKHIPEALKRMKMLENGFWASFRPSEEELNKNYLNESKKNKVFEPDNLSGGSTRATPGKMIDIFALNNPCFGIPTSVQILPYYSEVDKVRLSIPNKFSELRLDDCLDSFFNWVWDINLHYMLIHTHKEKYNGIFAVHFGSCIDLLDSSLLYKGSSVWDKRSVGKWSGFQVKMPLSSGKERQLYWDFNCRTSRFWKDLICYQNQYNASMPEKPKCKIEKIKERIIKHTANKAGYSPYKDPTFIERKQKESDEIPSFALFKSDGLQEQGLLGLI